MESDYIITTGRPLGRAMAVHSCVILQGVWNGGREAWFPNSSGLTYFYRNGRGSGVWGRLTPRTPLPAVGSGAPIRSIEKNDKSSAFATLIAILKNDSSLPTFATTVPTCAGLFSCTSIPCRDQNTVFMTYPMHYLQWSTHAYHILICNRVKKNTRAPFSNV